MVVSPGQSATLWLSHISGRYPGQTGPVPEDFMDAFRPGAPWDRAAKAVRLFKLSTQFLHRATDEQLRSVIDGLNARGIGIAMEGLMLPEQEHCGRGVEGYSGAGVMEAIAQRVQAFGGTLRSVAFDEPIWNGHHREGPGLCHDTIDALAQQMAENVAILRRHFPGIEFGDIEPLNAQTPPDFIEDILQFAGAFERHTGAKLAFAHADLIWQFDFRPKLREWRSRLHAAGMRFGVIVDGDPADATDAAWSDHAVERYHAILAEAGTTPDDVILQSWMSHPARLLPDSQPGTLTHVVLRLTAP